LPAANPFEIPSVKAATFAFPPMATQIEFFFAREK